MAACGNLTKISSFSSEGEWDIMWEGEQNTASVTTGTQ